MQKVPVLRSSIVSTLNLNLSDRGRELVIWDDEECLSRLPLFTPRYFCRLFLLTKSVLEKTSSWWTWLWVSNSSVIKTLHPLLLPLPHLFTSKVDLLSYTFSGFPSPLYRVTSLTSGHIGLTSFVHLSSRTTPTSPSGPFYYFSISEFLKQEAGFSLPFCTLTANPLLPSPSVSREFLFPHHKTPTIQLYPTTITCTSVYLSKPVYKSFSLTVLTHYLIYVPQSSTSKVSTG